MSPRPLVCYQHYDTGWHGREGEADDVKVIQAKASQQRNGYDCGLHVLGE